MYNYISYYTFTLSNRGIMQPLTSSYCRSAICLIYNSTRSLNSKAKYCIIFVVWQAIIDPTNHPATRACQWGGWHSTKNTFTWELHSTVESILAYRLAAPGLILGQGVSKKKVFLSWCHLEIYRQRALLRAIGQCTKGSL